MDKVSIIRQTHFLKVEQDALMPFGEPLTKKDEYKLLFEIEEAHFNLLTNIISCGLINKNGESLGIDLLNKEFISELRKKSIYVDLSDEDIKQMYPISSMLLLEKELIFGPGNLENSEKVQIKLFKYLYHDLVSIKPFKNNYYLFERSPRLILRKVAKQIKDRLENETITLFNYPGSYSSHQNKQIVGRIQRNLRVIDGHKEKLLISNRGFIIKQISSFLNKDSSVVKEWLDLDQEGNEGLIRTIDRFDTRTNYRLLTAAGPAINRRIFRYLEFNFSAGDMKYKKAYILLKEELGRSPYFKEVAAIMDASVKVETIRSHVMSNFFGFKHPNSMDTGSALDNEESLGLHDVLSSNMPTPEEIYAKKEVIEKVSNYLLKFLSVRDVNIFLRRVGFTESGKIETYEVIAKEWGISREWVRKIEIKIIQRFGEKLVEMVAADYDNYSPKKLNSRTKSKLKSKSKHKSKRKSKPK